MIARPSRAIALALLAATTSGCVGAVFTEVPPTFVALAEPVPAVEGTPEEATIVLVHATAPYDGGRQTVTMVRRGAQPGEVVPVGQVVPRSFAVGRIPPGEQTLIVGVPELDSPGTCYGIVRDTFEKGKVYAVNVAGFGGLVTVTLQSGHQATAARDGTKTGIAAFQGLGHILSKLSHMGVDVDRGAKEVRTHQEYWSGCVETALAHEKEMAGLTKDRKPASEVGVDRVAIPPPP